MGVERVFVSEALIGEPVGLVRHDDRLWTVRFGHLEIGRLDGYALRIIKMPVRALPTVSGLALPKCLRSDTALRARE